MIKSRLNRLVMLWLVQKSNMDSCYRCGNSLLDVNDFTIDHKNSWRNADKPEEVFFDMENIAFSHKGCNIGATNREKTSCPRGHAYDEENTRFSGNGKRRDCRACQRVTGGYGPRLRSRLSVEDLHD